jgi:hypothetical protein
MSVDTLRAVELLIEHRKKSTNAVETQQQEVAMRFFGPNSQRTAVKERGESFIEAAILMLKSNFNKYEGLEIYQEHNRVYLERLEKIKKHWDTITNHNEEHLHGLLEVLCEETNKSIFNGKKDTESLLKNLSNAENHVNWNKGRNPLETVTQIDENTIQVRIDTPITEFTKAQQEEWEKILEQNKKMQPKWFKKLSPWEQNYFTEKVKEWQTLAEEARIHRKPIPNLGTFMGVPPTTIRGYPGARNGYKSSYYTFKKDPNSQDKFLYTPVSHIQKIRSGHISPSSMKSSKERLKAAQENIEQLILAAVRDDVKNRTKNNFLIDLQTLITPPLKPSDNEMDLDRLNAIDNLRKKFKGNGFKEFLKENGIKVPKNYDPKIQLITSNYPVNKGRAPSNFFAPLKPFFAHFLEFPALVKSIKNEPITKWPMAFATWAFSPLVEAWRGINRAIENNRALSVLNNIKDELPKPLTKEQQMAADCLEKIKDISGPFQRLRNAVKFGINHNAERAALEQIAVSGLGGTRIGSCMSGKDREGAVSIHVAAMTAFHAKYGRLPPIPPASYNIDDTTKQQVIEKYKGDPKNPKISDKEIIKNYIKELRGEYEEMAAKVFLSGHDQNIAADNAKGANGLKESKVILGSRIVKKMKEILVQREKNKVYKNYWADSDPTKVSNQNAKLNKIEGDKLDSSSSEKAEYIKDLKKIIEPTPPPEQQTLILTTPTALASTVVDNRLSQSATIASIPEPDKKDSKIKPG